jgi:hypothetical protein
MNCRFRLDEATFAGAGGKEEGSSRSDRLLAWLAPGGVFLYEAGAVVSEAGLRVVDFARSLLGFGQRRLGRRGRPRYALAARVVDAEIVFRVLVQIFGGNPVIRGRGLARQRHVTLENLMRGAADSYVGTAAIKELIALLRSLLLLV